ncbi:MAG TPA: glycosyltransferase family 39 protein [Pirellulales bacterium]|nr:glycosyltransferase family 39 protein [Pirellulales bacterium]
MNASSPAATPPRDAAVATRDAAPWARRLAIALLLLGAAVRLRQYLGCPSYWYDEAYLLLNVFERSYGDLLGALDYNLVIPPGFLWISRAVYEAFGGGELSMRLPAVASSLAALVLMVPLARRFVGSWAWIGPVALVALSKHAVMHADEVRPYSTDLFVVEGLLLAACLCLSGEPSSRARKGGFAGLLVGAAVGPWLSFPSVFVLGGVSLALLCDAIRLRRLADWSRWSVFNAGVLLSVSALWYFDARHLYYGGLREHWEGWQGFPPGESLAAAAAWCLDRLPHIAQYATTDMGWPLVLLGGWGAAALRRRSTALAAAVTAPLALAMLAALLRRYPISDRTIFFAAPCVWLLAAAGLADLTRRLPAQFQWVRLAAVGILIAPGLPATAKSLAAVESKSGYREAFAYVHERWRPGDSLWVLHPEVYQVYFGRDRRPMGYDTPPEIVEERARAGRLWTVTVPEHPRVVFCPELFASLRSEAYVSPDKHPVDGLEAVLYIPAKPAIIASQPTPLRR